MKTNINSMFVSGYLWLRLISINIVEKQIWGRYKNEKVVFNVINNNNAVFFIRHHSKSC